MNIEKMPPIVWLSTEEARRAYGWNCRSTFHLKIKQGLVPQPVKLGPGKSLYPAHEVEAVNAAWLAGKSPEEVALIVSDLMAARKSMLGMKP